MPGHELYLYIKLLSDCLIFCRPACTVWCNLSSLHVFFFFFFLHLFPSSVCMFFPHEHGVCKYFFLSQIISFVSHINKVLRYLKGGHERILLGFETQNSPVVQLVVKTGQLCVLYWPGSDNQTADSWENSWLLKADFSALVPLLSAELLVSLWLKDWLQ